MGERKVLNKYFPADLDPSRKLPKGAKGPKADPNKAAPIRMMLPQSIRCSSCGAFMGAGTKLNALKENARDDYLGVKRFRFRFKCKECKSFITMLTDPKNAGYEVETGATANYSLNKEKKEQEALANSERDDSSGAGGAQDSLAALENRTLDSQREMEEMDRLEELARRNQARNAAAAGQQPIFLDRNGNDDNDDDDNEDEFVREAFAKKRQLVKMQAQAQIDQYDDNNNNNNDKESSLTQPSSSLGIVVTKKRKRSKKQKTNSLGLGGYGSDSS